MADLMTQAFQALQRSRGQSRLTGNQALMFGANQDQPLYEGYFDAMMKNRQADRAQALAERQLDASVGLQQQRLALDEKMIRQSNRLGWASLGAQALGYGLKAFEPAITQGVMDYFAPTEAPQIDMAPYTQALGGYESPGFMYDQFQIEPFDFDNIIEMDLGSFFDTWFDVPTLDWGSFIA